LADAALVFFCVCVIVLSFFVENDAEGGVGTERFAFIEAVARDDARKKTMP